MLFFFAYFSASKKRNIKRSPNGMKPSGAIFLEQTQSRGLGVDVKQPTRKPRGRGRAYPPGRTLHPRGPLVDPLADFVCLYMSIYPKDIKEQYRSGVSPPQAFVATKNLSRAVPAPCRRGNPSPVAIFIIPVLSMLRREEFSLGAEGMYQ